MDRKTIIAFGLIVLVIVILPYYYKLVIPEQAQQEPPVDSVAVVSEPVRQQTETAIGEEATPEHVEEWGGGGDQAYDPVAADLGFSAENSPESIIVDTPLYELVFSSRGAVLTDMRLKQYEGIDDGLVQLIRQQSADILSIVLYNNGRKFDTQGLRFQPNKKRISLHEGQTGSLLFEARNERGGVIRKTYTFNADHYPFELQLKTAGFSGIDSFYDVVWGSGLEITEPDSIQDIQYAQAYAYMGDELETFKGKGDRTVEGQASGITEWVAQRNKYFAAVILPRSSMGRGVEFKILAQPKTGKNRPKVYGMALKMDGKTDVEPAQFEVYCGPLDQSRLKEIHPNLEEMMSWGWPIIEPFSKGVLWSLKFLHGFIPNYGFVLIIFSVFVKILVWPLTHKSTRAMSRMSAVQPMMKEIQEKYKGQPEKLNKAVMQLYKEEGVNPFSSCWPTLLQMPLLYSLFIIFRATIQLRGEPFIFWITDLSKPDIIFDLPFSIPLYGAHVALLPIFMGITQFLMSKVMITDPKQKPTMYMMPFFMVMIFNNFPSGLTLYYTLFNLLTYLQQTYLKQHVAKPVVRKS
ncbi:membrane protein insertase YidC [bacterium]|nr:membrane protein insertase YidC [bacterium]